MLLRLYHFQFRSIKLSWLGCTLIVVVFFIKPGRRYGSQLSHCFLPSLLLLLHLCHFSKLLHFVLGMTLNYFMLRCMSALVCQKLGPPPITVVASRRASGVKVCSILKQKTLHRISQMHKIFTQADVITSSRSGIVWMTCSTFCLLESRISSIRWT